MVKQLKVWSLTDNLVLTISANIEIGSIYQITLQRALLNGLVCYEQAVRKTASFFRFRNNLGEMGLLHLGLLILQSIMSFFTIVDCV